MKRYFFDTQDGDTDIDQVGVECVSDDDAVREGVSYVGSLLREQPNLVNAGDFCVRVRSADEALAEIRVHLERH